MKTHKAYTRTRRAIGTFGLSIVILIAAIHTRITITLQRLSKTISEYR